MSLQPRLLLLHKHRTSGRVRYLRLPDGMLAFAPLPALAMLRDPGYAPKLYFHPATVTREAEAWLALPAGSIELDAEFHCWVDTPEGDVPVLLGAFTAIDPPFVAAERGAGRFIQLTEARQCREVELEILRLAYEHVLG